MVQYQKDYKNSAFQRFYKQAQTGQQREAQKPEQRLAYGQIQKNVAEEKKDRAQTADNRIKGLQQEAEQKVGTAVDTSAWEAPKRDTEQHRKIKPKDVSTQTTGAQLEQQHRAGLVEEVEGRIEQADQAYQKSVEDLQAAEEALQQELREAQQENITATAGPSELEMRSEAINRMLAQGMGGAGALGEL